MSVSVELILAIFIFGSGKKLFNMSTEQEMDTIYRAIQTELAENPWCPMVSDLYGPLLKRIENGDKDALKLALEMANDSLAPRKPILPFIRELFGRAIKRLI